MTCFPIFGPPQPFRPTRCPKFILSSFFFIFISYFFHILGPESNSSLLNTKDVPTQTLPQKPPAILAASSLWKPLGLLPWFCEASDFPMDVRPILGWSQGWSAPSLSREARTTPHLVPGEVPSTPISESRIQGLIRYRHLEETVPPSPAPTCEIFEHMWCAENWKHCSPLSRTHDFCQHMAIIQSLSRLRTLCN